MVVLVAQVEMLEVGRAVAGVEPADMAVPVTVEATKFWAHNLHSLYHKDTQEAAQTQSNGCCHQLYHHPHKDGVSG